VALPAHGRAVPAGRRVRNPLSLRAISRRTSARYARTIRAASLRRLPAARSSARTAAGPCAAGSGPRWAPRCRRGQPGRRLELGPVPSLSEERDHRACLAHGQVLGAGELAACPGEMPGDPEPFGTVGLAEAEPLEFAADGAYLVWRGRGRAGEHGVQRPALLP